MQIKKILLKDRAGRIVGAATLTSDSESTLALPSNSRLLAVEDGGRKIAFDDMGHLSPCAPDRITFLAEDLRGARYTGSTLPLREATFRAGLLLAEREEADRREKSLASPLNDEGLPTRTTSDLPSESKEEVAATDGEEENEDLTERFGITAVEGRVHEEKEGSKDELRPESAEEEPPKATIEESDLIRRAEELISTGEPCPLFEDLLKGSRWAKIESEEGAQMIGVLETEGEKCVLFALAGNREDLPAEEEKVLTFLPIDEERGFFIIRGDA